jgi:hypothetical protein
MTANQSQMKYAYLVTLVGVALATITTAYTAIRSYMFSQAFRSRPTFSTGNFTRSQFVNFARGNQFGMVNPYGGFANIFMILGVAIAVIGVVWLGIALRKPSAPAR